MRNPFSKMGKTSSDSCCTPLTFEEEPAGDQQPSTGCCTPPVFEDQPPAHNPQAEEGAELPARGRQAGPA